MKIFVVNCGSSSIKYQLFDMDREAVLAKGLLERVGTDQAVLHHTVDQRTCDRQAAAPDHAAGLRIVLAALTDAAMGPAIEDVSAIDGVGHRVVHGGEEISGSVRIDESVLAVVRRNAELAPLHNPPNLAGIKAATAAIPSVPHVAVFDTAFLSTLPPRAYRYAVPKDWYTNHHVRKYGFHGTSHRYVTGRTAQLLGKDVRDVNLITCHLGNGCSMTAVRAGKAVDHSMGMTPLEGLIMGTRSGDIDPAVVLHMLQRGLTGEAIDEALNKHSGLLGVSGIGSDMRDLAAAAEAGNAEAALAVEMFAYRVAKYAGAYVAILPRVDAVVLTGGIGENAVGVRETICGHLAALGAVLDSSRNAACRGGKAGPITADGARLPVWVVPTNEELLIARDTAAFVVAAAAAKGNPTR
jgi:acetate kinase